jgi:hypothetical protein
MRKLTLFILPLFVLACNSPRDNDREERDTTAENNTANAEVLFRCDTISNSNQHKLSLLLSTYDEAIPVDTLASCDSIPKSNHAIYQIPENIKGVAVSDKDVYYSAIKNDQVIIMKSAREDTMNYEVHLSIPLEPVVKEGE